jgi:tripartite-type tricarboxylate transporter receptor subunit TctC
MIVPRVRLAECLAIPRCGPHLLPRSGGPGSAPGLWGELFNKLAGVKLVPANYRGTGPALPDLISGRVQVMFDVAVTAVGPVRLARCAASG